MSVPVMRLTLLGGAVIRSNGEPLGGPAAHRHRLALLALLAAHQSPVSRDKLIALLWPERDGDSGRNLLKVAVHELRKLLGEHALRTTGDQLSLDTSVIACDVVEFEAAIARNAPQEAAALYGGPFMDGFHMKDAPEFERWGETQRNRLAGVYSATLEKVALLAEKASDWRGAVEWWRKLAAEDPLRVDVALRLMRALDASGDRAAAIKHAEIHASLRKREFGIEADAAVDSLSRELASRKMTRKKPTDEVFEEHFDDGEADVVDAFTTRVLTRRGLVGTIAALVIVAATVATIGYVVNKEADEPTSNSLAVIPFRVVGSDSSL